MKLHLFPAFLGAALFAALPTSAKTLAVTSKTDGQPGSISEVIGRAVSGDTITFSVRGRLQVKNQLDLSKNLTIHGPGIRDLFLTSSNGQRALHIRTGAIVSVTDLTFSNCGLRGADGKPGAAGQTDSDGNGTDGGDGQDGTGVRGGAIYNEGTLNLTRCVLRDNGVFGGSGGQGGAGGSAATSGNIVGTGGDGGASGTAQGGAIFNIGTLSLNTCTLNNNVAASGNGGDGGYTPSGGIGGSGGNSAGAQGAAVYNSGAIIFNNCTLGKNHVLGGSPGSGGSSNAPVGTPGIVRGGAIFNTGALNLNSVTVSANDIIGGNYRVVPFDSVEGAGGGVASNSGTVNIVNTIIAGNITTVAMNNQLVSGKNPDVFGKFTSGGYNLIGRSNGSTGFTQPTDKTGTNAAPLDAKLGNLTYYGGVLQTFEPQVGSPALDAGNTGLVQDARGFPRPVNLPGLPNIGDSSDIGAVEVQNTASQTLVVNTLDDHADGACTTEDCSLREAIGASFATPGTETITFASALTGTITLKLGALTIESNVKIAGPGQSKIAVSGNLASRVFEILEADATISGLSVVRGKGRLLVENGISEDGAGVYIYYDSTVDLHDCALNNNQSASYGGAISNYGELSLSKTSFRGNQAPFGGALMNGGQLDMSLCIFSGNQSGRGGAIGDSSYRRKVLNADRCRFLDNEATDTGGAIFIDFFGGTHLNLTSCEFRGNRVTSPIGAGGAVFADEGIGFSATDCLFAENNAGFGGAINCSPLDFFGIAAIKSCAFTGNSARSGGAIMNSGGPLRIDQSVFNSNAATEFSGGAIWNDLSDFSTGNLTLTDCALNDNTAAKDGAGLFNAGDVRLHNCTLSGNKAGSGSDGKGGAIENTTYLVLRHCTLTNNQAALIGGGLHSKSQFGPPARAIVQNTIIAGNSAPQSPDVFGAAESGGFNLIGVKDGSSGFTKATDKTGPAAVPLAARLTAFQFNGATLFTPSFGSPALDNGTAAGLTKDARGVTRPIDSPGLPNAVGGDGSDIGAVEAALAP